MISNNMSALSVLKPVNLDVYLFQCIVCITTGGAIAGFSENRLLLLSVSRSGQLPSWCSNFKRFLLSKVSYS